MADTAQQKIAIITGGGSGIGEGCALRLAGMGYHLILLGRTEAKLQNVAAAVQAKGATAETFVADIRDWDRLGELAALVEERGIDLLINSAGGQFLKPAKSLSRNGWDAVVNVNLSGTFYACRQLYPALRRRKGAIVNLVADVWQRGAPNMVHSGAARAGVISLTRTLALEWGNDGVRVNTVSPGLFQTPGLAQYDVEYDVTKIVPLQRFGTMDEIVDAILFMGHATYITGEVLTVDGGYYLT
jgi:citronellol/citronellal dehydrogenase